MMNPITRVAALLSQMGPRLTVGILLVGAILGSLTLTHSCGQSALKEGAVYTVVAADWKPDQTLLPEPQQASEPGKPSLADEFRSNFFSDAANSGQSQDEQLSDEEESQKMEAENPYAVLKVLKVTPDGVLYRLYSNRYTQRPKSVDPESLITLPPGALFGMKIGSNGRPTEIQLRGGLGYAPKAVVTVGQGHTALLFEALPSDEDRADTQTIEAHMNAQPSSAPVKHLSPSPWKDKPSPSNE